MDRQALPSIILSVAIVGFFAVMLYPHDGEPRPRAKGRGPRASSAARSESAGAKAAPTRAVAVRGEMISAPGPPAASNPEDRTGPEPARPVVGPQVGPAARAARVDRPAEAPLSAVRVASRSSAARTAPGWAAVAPSRSATTSSRAPEERLARAPFTVVGSGETIADVARRVYGAGGDAGALWRANRDVLKGPDSPVAPGTVLRTPAAPMR